MGGGGAPPTNGGGGGGPGGGGIDYTGFFQTIISLLLGVFGIGGSLANTDILTVGNTATALYGQTKLVKKAILQNLSATDNITILAVASAAGKVSPVTAGKGTVLNLAPAAGQGGGSMEVGNIDLSSLSAITSTNNTQSLSVYYEL